MAPKILATLGILVYALVVPVLEINDTHVFNPEWPTHARLHEVWQLLTNSLIGAYTLWLMWSRDAVRLASHIGLILSGSFLAAFALRDGYGGSMNYWHGPEPTLLGVDVGILGVAVIFVLFLAARLLHRQTENPSHR